jgi:hypothetical protein
MKKIIILLIIAFIFFNCRNKSENEKSESKSDLKTEQIENIEETNEIVQAIINQDSLDILKSNSESIAFCTELRKITIEIPIKQKNGIIFPPAPGNIFINNLLNDKVNGEIFFSSKDSLAIILQNSNPEKIKIKESITEKLNTTTFEKEMTKRKKGKEYDFYEMTIPIFSLDKQKVYIELNHSCGALCGNGKGIYLKKINGKWKIVEKWETWIS